MPSPSRRKGDAGERLATDYLIQRGYRVLQRNYAVRGGEIDIIAEHGATLCFVEVRTRRRADFGHPVETVGLAKQRRIALAARQYLSCHGGEQREVRFDVVGIVLEPAVELRLVQGAFEVE